LDKYRVAIIDDSKEKLDLLSNEFDFYDAQFETMPLIIDNKEWTKEKVADFLKKSKIDAVVTDYLLTSRNNGINYNGDKIIQELSLEFRNLPIIMISEVAKEARNSDINPFLFIERSDFIDNSRPFIDKISKAIRTNRKTIAEYENELINLLKKTTLNDDEKSKLVKLDNFLEETLSYESRIPNYYKNNALMKELEDNVIVLDQILEKLNNA
jgi:hypothetical protein